MQDYAAASFTASYMCCCHSFGGTRAPLHLSAQNHLTSELYALFQGWLLLAQPPGCHRDSSLSHSALAGALNDRAVLST